LVAPDEHLVPALDRLVAAGAALPAMAASVYEREVPGGTGAAR